MTHSANETNELTKILKATAEIGRRWDTFASVPFSQFTNAIAEQAAETQRFVAEIGKRNDDFRDLCLRLGWPPPGDIGVSVIDLITAAEKGGELTLTDVASLVLEFYTPERVAEIAARWKNNSWLADRHPILLEGIANHLDRRYFSSVCLLLTQVEGVIGDFLGKKPNPKNDAALIFFPSKLSAAAKTFYLKMANETFEWSSESRNELARHPIMHGKNVEYGTATHSLQTILILDWVTSAIDAHRTAGSKLATGIARGRRKKRRRST